MPPGWARECARRFRRAKDDLRKKETESYEGRSHADGDQDVPEMTQRAKNNENDEGHNFRAIVVPSRNHRLLLSGVCQYSVSLSLAGACAELRPPIIPHLCLHPIRAKDTSYVRSGQSGFLCNLIGDVTGANREGPQSVFARGTKFFVMEFALQQ